MVEAGVFSVHTLTVTPLTVLLMVPGSSDAIAPVKNALPGVVEEESCEAVKNNH